MGTSPQNVPRLLPPRNLDFVPKLHQHLRYALTVFALDFDRPILDCSACATFLFEFFGEGFQILFGEDEVLDDRNDLATASA